MRPRLPVHQRGKSLTVSEICAAPGQETRQMFADHGISGKREAEFLESDPTRLLWQVADCRLCEKAVEDDLLKRGSFEFCRHGSGEEARAPCGDGNRRLAQGVVVEQIDFGFGGSVDQCKELPRIYGFSLGFELGLKRIGKRQIHVVAAQKNVFSDAEPVEFQCAIVVGNSDEAEIGGSAPDVADQDNITRTDQGAPFPTCLRDPGVESRLWLLEQSDFAETGGLP